jgi:hypothetical protein
MRVVKLKRTAVAVYVGLGINQVKYKMLIKI